MPEVIFSVDRDLSVPMAEQAVPGHNRWHPDIPPVATVDPGCSVAYRRAALNAIEYLKRAMGYTGEQANLLLGAAPVEGRIGGIVDIPNCGVTLGIPLAIFDRDILPH